MPSLAPRLAGVRPSPTAAISEKVRAYAAAGQPIVNLGEGELDFDTPEHVKEAAIEAIRSGETKYTSVSGTPRLKAAILEKFKRENGLAYEPRQVIAGCGAKQLIFNALLATVQDGEEVVVPSPHWVSYPDMVSLAGSVVREVRCEEADQWKLRAENLAAAISPRTRWVILNSPNNPTGAVLQEAELVSIGDVLRQHPDVLILSDDIYERLVYVGVFHTFAEVNPDLIDRTLTVNGVSKSYSMTGWRLGYAAGPEWLVTAMETLQSQSTSNASSISQAAAAAALQDEPGFMSDWLSELKHRRGSVLDAIRQAAGLRCAAPEGAFYAFVNCTEAIGKRTPAGEEIKSDLDLANFFLDEAGVAMVHGAAFGRSPYLRLAFGVERRQLNRALGRIVEVSRLLT